MPTLQVRHVDEKAIRTFKLRAATQGKSLQAYLHDLLTDLAQRPTTAEWFAEIDHQASAAPPEKLTFSFAAEALREDRDAR